VDAANVVLPAPLRCHFVDLHPPNERVFRAPEAYPNTDWSPLMAQHQQGSEPKLHAPISGERRSRHIGARIGQSPKRVGLPFSAGVKSPYIGERAEKIVMLVERVVDQAEHLDVLSNLIGRVQIQRRASLARKGEPEYEKPAIVSCQQLIVSVEQVIHTDSEDVAVKIGRMMEGVSANTRANGA
jgi:hypothetical protein